MSMRIHAMTKQYYVLKLLHKLSNDTNTIIVELFIVYLYLSVGRLDNYYMTS